MPFYYYATGWDTAVAGGGIIGGILLDRAGAISFAWVVMVLLIISLLSTVFAMNNSLQRKI
ncbi:hypothetical protein [Xenorhabdus thuongxuanensis]|uniref:hypothetical protein n=1 Tax=Xenorhabdus thuongxuanensis TaxID=1873484 RepID=UPI00094021D8|nr:hypothetical protein [Xenorhabdus thuongxuanensis]